MSASIKDVHAVLVDSALDRTDLMAEAADAAATVNVKSLLQQAHEMEGPPGDNLVTLLMRHAVLSSVQNLGAQQDAAATQVVAEAEAIKRQDVTKVPAVTDSHIADARMARAEAAKQATEK